MLTKDFFRGVVLGLVILALLIPNLDIKLESGPLNTAPAAGGNTVVNTISQELVSQEDRREEALRKYLESKDSPLADFVGVFIEVADEYDLDWKFLPAIAGIESNFAKVQLKNSHNPFGWGGGYIYFDSYPEAIKTVGEGLYRLATDYGLETPEEIGPTYTPPNYKNWIFAVKYLMGEIDTVEI